MIYWEEEGRHQQPRIWGKASPALQPAAAAAAEVVVVAAASAALSAASSTSRATWF